MATKAADRPGPRLDVQPRKITTDRALNAVSPESPEAAFSWLPADLERVRARREELGLNDDKVRAAAASQKAELAIAERKLAVHQAEVDALKASIAEQSAGDKPAASTDGQTPKERLQDEARELGLDPEGTVDALKARIAEARATA